jgi:ComF family protein
MNHLFFDLASLLFPVYCPVCRSVLHQPGSVLCLKCELDLPRTDYTQCPDNPVAQLFWGRASVDCATSLFRFEKGSRYQALLHQLKYRGSDQIGVYLGKLLGNELKRTVFADCDVLVPVPLHRKKLRKRGYNQSERIAAGVSSILGIPVRSDILYRRVHTLTQTNKGRYDRAVNMEGAFSVSGCFQTTDPLSILLIDDVVTTGSTLEACANALLKIPCVTVMIATVACA